MILRTSFTIPGLLLVAFVFVATVGRVVVKAFYLPQQAITSTTKSINKSKQRISNHDHTHGLTTSSVVCVGHCGKHTAISTTTNLNMIGKKNRKAEKYSENESAPTSNNDYFVKLQNQSPATLILLPFVVLFGLDLLLNIIFITKRSIEYIVFGQIPNTDTWF